MQDLLPFFIIFLSGIILSEFFSRLHLPWVIALIVAGIFVGDSGLGIVHMSHALDVTAQFGLIVLMCMAGLETRLSDVVAQVRQVGIVSIVNSLIPFIVGTAFMLLLGYDADVSLLVGAVCLSSSVALVIPILQNRGLLKLPIGRTALSVITIQDVVSLVLLSLLLRVHNPETILPTWLFFIVLVAILGLFQWLVPKITLWLKNINKNQKGYEGDIRVVFLILIGAVVLFQIIGLHPTIAAFFVGMMLADCHTSERLRAKLHVLAYGFFIPLFFVVLGLSFDFGVLSAPGSRFVIFGLVTLALVTKFASGAITARMQGFMRRESFLIGSVTMAHLSTPLVIAYTGTEIGLFDSTVRTALIALTIVSAFFVPVMVEYFSHAVIRHYANKKATKPRAVGKRVSKTRTKVVKE